jgi:NTE family protein
LTSIRLRRLLEREIDFDALSVARRQGPQVFVCATNVRTGRGEIFSGARLSADAVMASACLPMLFKAVEIDGEAVLGWWAIPAIRRCIR